jgi:hypothetical protein
MGYRLKSESDLFIFSAIRKIRTPSKLRLIFLYSLGGSSGGGAGACSAQKNP